MDRDDVRMVEGGDGPRLALEPGPPFGVRDGGLGKDLDGDVAPQARVTSLVDLAHTAGAKGTDDLVQAEADAKRQGHRCTSEECRSAPGRERL
jgi:hypothetical protein